MATRLLFVRHGDSWHKLDGVLGGPATCRGLTPLGRSQATDVVERLGHKPSTPRPSPGPSRPPRSSAPS